MTHRRISHLLAATALALGAQAAAQAQTVKLATSAGDIVVQLDAAKAPKTVANFVE
jgi:peptidyl-prolyl cis-trans isomerase A (cyclophilin A)